MGDLVAALIIFGIPAVWIFFKLLGRYQAGQRRALREAERLEDQRLKACHTIILDFANIMGYAAKSAISKKELENLINGGIQAEDLAGIIWERCQDLPGLRLGKHYIDEGVEFPVKLLDELRARHVYIIGKTGTGKTTLIRNLILQDLANGEGLGVLAPEQELLTTEILPFIPEERWQDIIYVNPADTAHPVPFNPLELHPDEDLDLKADQTITIFKRVFGESRAAPRMEEIIRQSLYLLIQIPGTTLLDMPKLLDPGDSSYRRWALSQVSDEQSRHFWQQTYPRYPKDAHLPILNRLGALLQPAVVRNLLCTPGQTFTIRQAMDEGKVLLFNLSDGILGESNSQLIGQLIVASFQLAAMSRADTEPEARRPFYLYLDEFQNFCSVAATSYERMLSRCRKYNLGLILSHQQTGQINDSVLKEIFGNVSTFAAFELGASDSHRLAREFVGEINGIPTPANPTDFQSLRRGETLTKIKNSVFPMQTYPPPRDGSSETRDEVIRSSRERYSVSPDGGRPKVSPQDPDPDALEGLDPESVF